MSSLFLAVVNMSITASYVALIVLFVRLLLRKAPKVFSYVLWAVVFIRLLCPNPFESVLSLLPETEIIPYDIVTNSNPVINTGVANIDSTLNPSIQSSLASVTETASVNLLGIVLELATVIWLTGIIILLCFNAVSYWNIKRKISTATLLRENIFETDQIQSPFVLGFIHPKIYIPTGLTEEELDYIIKHEKVHIKRKDYLIKPIAFLAIIIHWFNPLMWLCYFLMTKDMEMSCDESVISQFPEEDIRLKYSNSLFTLSRKQSGLLNPLAFGESNVKSRIKNILRYKKPSFWFSVAIAVLLVIIAVGLIANPKDINKSEAEKLLKYKTEYVGNASKVGNIVYLLDFPEKVHYDYLELFTENIPYGVTVHLKTDTETRKYYEETVQQTPFKKNALIMFSLIDNVEFINFNLSDNQNDYLMKYTREWADNWAGKDVRLFSQDQEEFTQFLRKTEKIASGKENSLSRLGGAAEPSETLFEIPGQNIKLSAVAKEGTYENFTLEVNGNKHIFNWKNVINPTYAPQLLLSDLNNDGSEELIVILTTGTGTGVYLTEAHVINPKKLEEINVASPQSILEKRVKTNIKNNKAKIIIDKKEIVIDIGNLDIVSENLFSNVVFDNIRKFEVIDDELIVTLGAQISPASFIGEIEIKYEFQDNMYQGNKLDFKKFNL